MPKTSKLKGKPTKKRKLTSSKRSEHMSKSPASSSSSPSKRSAKKTKRNKKISPPKKKHYFTMKEMHDHKIKNDKKYMEKVRDFELAREEYINEEVEEAELGQLGIKGLEESKLAMRRMREKEFDENFKHRHPMYLEFMGDDDEDY
jgi:hypothetical protein